MVVGAGASGLAAAAALGRRGRAAVVLERDPAIGGTWARRYARLHLHTVRRFSALPYRPLPRSWPRYVPKDLYARYLAEYAGHLGIDVRTNQPVERIRPDDGGWAVETPEETWRTEAVVVATGRHNVPRRPRWPGMETFAGPILHSAEYDTGRPFAGRRALVVGIGNSGAEIAADLVDEGAARVAISVRTSPPITKREILGIPAQLLGIALAPLPPRLVDRLGRAMRRIGTGDLRRHGIGVESWGPFTARRPPVIDVGFVERLKAGRIDVRPDVERFTKTGVVFADGTEEPFDVLIAATGFSTGLERLIDATGALDERGYPGDAPPPGLFFAGYSETPRGQLFEANRGARRLAVAVDRYLTPRHGPHAYS